MCYIQSSTAIRHLERDSHDRGIPHLYYYFNFRDESTQTCENFLRSIMSQLLNFFPETKIPRSIMDLYVRRNSGKHRPSVKDLTTCFIAVIETLPEVRLFGDAFDECTDWNNLWHFSSQLAKARSTALHFLFTSRPERHIRDAVNSLDIPTVDLTCPEMNLDIKNFVIEQLDDPRFTRISVDGKEMVKESLISRAGGMCVPQSISVQLVLPLVRFRWVALQLLAVSKCRSKNALHKILSLLPSSLDETYARILDRIEDEDRPRVLCILQFICFGARPIRMEEAAMLWLVGDNTGGPICVHDIPFDSEDIFDFFGGLVSIEQRVYAQSDSTWSFLSDEFTERLSIVQLAHFSVKEYLLSPRAGYWVLTEEVSHLSIIQCSIAYYLHAVAVDGMSPLPPDKLLEKHSVAEYCSQYMSDHLDHLTARDHLTLTSTFHRLLHPDSNNIATRFSSLFFRRRWLSHDYNIPITVNHALALILAAVLGLSEVASWLLTFSTVQEQIDAFASNCDCGPPILEAAAKGHMDVIRDLLENGANINQEGRDGRNALFVASQNGQETAVRMLIEARACVNNEDGMTPIQVASIEGHQGIVEMLIKAGADVNLGPQPALYWASAGGHEDVVQTLILAGADVNLEGYLGTALHTAAHLHYPGGKVVKLLIDAGANVNQLAGCYGTTLQAAAAGGTDETSALEAVRILIRAGTNVNLVGGKYGTALQAAVYWNWLKIVEKLIDAGADVNLVGGQYGTALRAAVVSWYYSEEGRIAIVQMLIQAGADINLKGGKNTTPLEAALVRRQTEIVQILRDAGANPPKRPLLSLTDSESDAGEREGKRPRICDCTVTNSECDCASSTW
jgi:ankyrin repeat protein